MSINKLEKDVLTIMLINKFVPSGIKSILSEYDKSKITELSPKLRFMVNDETAQQALVDLATETYNRILKKTTWDVKHG